MELKEKEQLLEKIAELQEKVEKLEVESKSPFDVKNGEVAFYNYHGYMSISSDYWNKHFINGNIPCKDKNIVEQRQKRHHLSDLLEKFAYENKAVATEKLWKDNGVYKYYVIYDYCLDIYKVDGIVGEKNINTIYFDDEQICQRAINEVVIPFMEGNNEN